MEGEKKLPKKKADSNKDIENKLEYLSLDLDNIPKDIKKYKP